MPTYEYICQDCGVLSEKNRSIAERDQPFKCPECRSMNTKKAVTAAAVNLPVDPRNLRGSGKADFDKIVGADAQKRWQQIEAGSEQKKAVREASGQYALTRTPEGGYAPAGEQNLSRRKKAYKKFEHAKKVGTKIEH